MNHLEAQWIGARLAEIPAEDLFPVLDIGSGSLEFRTCTQPYIEQYIFAPLRRRGGPIWHLDRLDAPGVDIVGDLDNAAFLADLRCRLRIRTAILGNVLEHVPRRFDLARAVAELVPEGGHLLVTGPMAYPFHAEPVDTMFRPTLQSAAAHFPSTRLVHSRAIDLGNWHQWRRDERGRSLKRLLLRLSVPFYRPRCWRGVIGQAPYLFRHARTYALMLQKVAPPVPPDAVGVVVIGRNEASRLPSCLRSVIQPWTRVVYVDSGSTDNSVAVARVHGVNVVELDRSAPFTAARGRNAGFESLSRLDPPPRWIQFVDGDCEINPRWWAGAQATLAAHPDIAIVTGRIRERYPEASIYNRLCDLEWNTPIGNRQECGGIVMMRTAAFEQVRGFNPRLVAGEEPELCVRLRDRGWRILGLDTDVGWHDAAMLHFSQWWKRELRGGYATAEGAALHGRSACRHRVRETQRDWFWGAAMPLVILAATVLAGPPGLLSVALYSLPLVRAYRSIRSRASPSEARWYAAYCTASKFPRMFGQLRYWRGRVFGRPSTLIEYKHPAPNAVVTAVDRSV